VLLWEIVPLTSGRVHGGRNVFSFEGAVGEQMADGDDLDMVAISCNLRCFLFGDVFEQAQSE